MLKVPNILFLDCYCIRTLAKDLSETMQGVPVRLFHSQARDSEIRNLKPQILNPKTQNPKPRTLKQKDPSREPSIQNRTEQL